MRVKFKGMRNGKEYEYCWTGVEEYVITPYGVENFCRSYPGYNINKFGIDHGEKQVFENLSDVLDDIYKRLDDIGVDRNDIGKTKETMITFVKYCFDSSISIGAVEHLVTDMLLGKSNWEAASVSLKFKDEDVRCDGNGFEKLRVYDKTKCLLVDKNDYLEVVDDGEVVCRIEGEK